MPVSDLLLYHLAKRWPSPMREMQKRFEVAGMENAPMVYAQERFDYCVRRGIVRPVTGLDVLEIGCGHGGISAFLATAGAKSVIAIDISVENLEHAVRFTKLITNRLKCDEFPIQFKRMDACKLDLCEASVDLVFADSSFEHFVDAEGVMRESFRVLRPGGGLLVPTFSSIYSQYGLHLKWGLKLPWANLLFSEKAIVRAMQRLAKEDPKVIQDYPGLKNDPQRVRDLRQYGDLNDITLPAFRRMAHRTGFTIERLSPLTTMGKIVARTWPLNKTLLVDVLSGGATAFLRKPQV